jgi:hypothetical protein
MIATENNLLENAKVVLDNASAYTAYVPAYNAVVCVVKKSFITKNDFEALFNSVGACAKENNAEKIVFDKRNMQIFDQASMTWYHTKWKEELLQEIGLNKHRKLLPNDKFFRKSVEIGREKIAREHNFDFSRFDIQYFDDLEEALKN